MPGVLDVLNAPWAILPEKLAEITDIYGRHLRGDKIDVRAVHEQLKTATGVAPQAGEPLPYQVVSGVAILPIDGVIAKKMNLFTYISGGVSTQLLARHINQALADADVNSVLLTIDSPGGAVDGTEELARVVFDARGGEKPIVAWVDGLMASAAYWVGSAADAIYIGASTDNVGSIGVVTQHVDYSRFEEQRGIKTTEVYAGKYKRIASEHAPLTDEGRAHLQERVDYLYSLFVDTVAAHRGVSSAEVLKHMADGRIFIGQQAVAAGLVDGASTLDALVASLASGQYRRMRPATGQVLPATGNDANDAGVASSPEPNPYEDRMDIKTLKEKHPEIAAALIAEGHTAGEQKGRADGAAAELARIKDVEAQSMPGHGELISRLKYDGKTTGPEAAIQVLAAERTKLGKRAEDIAADAAAAGTVLPGATPAVPGAPAAGTPEQSLEARCKAKWDADADLRGQYADDFGVYLAAEKGIASGRVRILGQTAKA